MGVFGPLRRAMAERSIRGGKAAAMLQVVAMRALALTVNIATSLLTAGMLGPSGRGEQAALVLAPNFLGGIGSLGLHGALIYNLKADPERQRELLGNGILLTLFAGTLAMVGGWIAEPYWLRQYSPHTILFGRLLMLTTPMIVISFTLSGAAEAQGWFGLVNRMYYLQSVPTLAMLGGLALLGRLTPITSACVYVLPTVGTFVYMMLQIVRRLRPIFRPRREPMLRLLRYGARLAGVDLLGTLSSFVDQMIIVACLSAGMAGTYAVALSSARLLNVVQGGIGAVLFPSVAARETAAVVRAVAQTFRIATLLVAGLACGLAVVGPKLLLFAYGAKFAPAIVPFRVLLLAMTVEAGARILYHVYAGCGRPELTTLFEGLAVAVLVLAMLLLVPPFATLGAALAVLCAALFRITVAIAGLRLVLGMALPRLLFGAADLRAIRSLLAGRRAANAPVEVAS
jgi:O-antigen/teichoic acid export membrane protein